LQTIAETTLNRKKLLKIIRFYGGKELENYLFVGEIILMENIETVEKLVNFLTQKLNSVEFITQTEQNVNLKSVENLKMIEKIQLLEKFA